MEALHPCAATLLHIGTDEVERHTFPTPSTFAESTNPIVRSNSFPRRGRRNALVAEEPALLAKLAKCWCVRAASPVPDAAATPEDLLGESLVTFHTLMSLFALQNQSFCGGFVGVVWVVATKTHTPTGCTARCITTQSTNHAWYSLRI